MTQSDAISPADTSLAVEVGTNLGSVAKIPQGLLQRQLIRPQLRKLVHVLVQLHPEPEPRMVLPARWQRPHIKQPRVCAPARQAGNIWARPINPPLLCHHLGEKRCRRGGEGGRRRRRQQQAILMRPCSRMTEIPLGFYRISAKSSLGVKESPGMQ